MIPLVSGVVSHSLSKCLGLCLCVPGWCCWCVPGLWPWFGYVVLLHWFICGMVSLGLLGLSLWFLGDTHL